MPIYQIKNVSKHLKVGIWKLTETKEDLLRRLLKKGFLETDILQTKNEQYLKQWLAVRLMINSFFDKVSITYDDYGKPYLDNDWFISVSHSNEYAVIIINRDNPCGIDIEKIDSKVDRIKHKFLNPIDMKIVTSLEALTIYWGAKEALYKYYGKKEVIFIEHLFIENFSKDNTSFKGRIDLPTLKKTIPMAYEKIENYILVYTL